MTERSIRTGRGRRLPIGYAEKRTLTGEESFFQYTADQDDRFFFSARLTIEKSMEQSPSDIWMGIRDSKSY